MKHILTLATALILTACGGGGGTETGTAPDVQVDAVTLGATYPSVHVPMVLGKFKGGQTQFLVQAHYKFLGNGQTAPIPVKIYQLNSDGTMIDSTMDILGGAITLSTNVPLVADFNHDGIDDLFFPGFSDTQDLLPSVAFISRAGQSHIRVDLSDPVWSHGAVAIDINRDGHVDVVNNSGEAWINDGQGNFTFRSHSYLDVPGMWMHGSGICAGDFNRTGRSQLVITDQMINASIGPIADTVIFEIDDRGLPTAQHYLPSPVLDRNSTTTEISHDVDCKVADLNNDGLPDILVFSRPWARGSEGWSNQGTVQVLINQGNWQFVDATDQVLANYNTNVLISYTALITDLNGDGRPDLWSGYFDFSSGKANQAFVNNGSGIFNPVNQSLINSFNASGGMLPVKFGNQWAFVFSTMDPQSGVSLLYLTKPKYTF